jgi:integrase
VASGHIRQRGSGYEVVIYLGLDPVTGRKRQISRSARTKRAAEALRNELLVKYAGGRGGTEATFARLVEYWLEVAELAPSSRAAYTIYLERHILPALGVTPLDKLTPDVLDRFYLALKRKGLSAASVHKAHNVISSALSQAVRWRWLAENPAARATPPRVPKPKITAPSPEDVLRLLQAAEERDPDLGMFLRLSAVSGARRGELCAVRWGDLDLDAGTLTISRAISGGVEQGTKTGTSRVVALDAGTVEALRRHQRRWRERMLAVGAQFTPKAFVFSADAGARSPWRPDGVTARFMRLRNRVGVPARLHDLRHFVATQALAGGMPVRTVSGRLGHRRASTTSDIYASFVAESDRAAAEFMGRLLDG